MTDWALVRDNVIENIIVVDNDQLPAGVEPFDPDDYVADESNDWQRAVNLDALTQEHRPAIGWIFHRGRGYVPPAEISVDRESIPADGKTVATVTYRDNALAPAAEVPVDVNGAESQLHLTAGVGEVAVASSTAGDTVVVRIAGSSVSVAVKGA